MVNIEDIQKLRNITGLGIVSCKKALEESNGDLNKAIEILRIQGQSVASEKSHRTALEGIIYSYIHHSGKLGVLVEVNCETDFVARNEDFKNFVKEIALQIAGANPPPMWVSKEDVSQDVIEKEKNIYQQQLKDENKPPQILEKIIQGKLEKFYQQYCLLEQPSIRDPKTNVKSLLNQIIARIGEKIVIKRFARFRVGEY